MQSVMSASRTRNYKKYWLLAVHLQIASGWESNREDKKWQQNLLSWCDYVTRKEAACGIELMKKRGLFLQYRGGFLRQELATRLIRYNFEMPFHLKPVQRTVERLETEQRNITRVLLLLDIGMEVKSGEVSQ